jgi:hypothetical protein
MQLSGSNRREVIEDLLDIKIFSAMNNIIRDKIRDKKDAVRTLELKKTSLKEKLEMQQNFMEEIEKRGKERIDSKRNKINNLDEEIDHHSISNKDMQDEISNLIKKQEKYVGASKKLKELGNLKGKISNKASTVRKEHKFFSKNTVCPTCTQNINEELRLNKLDEAQQKAKQLQSGYQELEKAIENEEERERQFIQLTKESTKLTNEISQNNVKISGYQKQIRELESEIQTITNQLENRNSEHEKLTEFDQKLKKTYESLGEKKQEILHHDFAYSLLKDGGVKSKIIKKYLPLINQQVNKYLRMMDFSI